jgi:hypothetical protein
MATGGWANRALNHARLLAALSPGRGSATRAEAQAAEYVRKHLAGLGYHHLHTQPFTGSRSIWFFLALVFGLAVMGHLAFALLQPAVGRWPAWVVSAVVFGFSFYLLWRKFTFRSHPFEEYLPRGPSQNVILVAPPTGEVRQQVVVIAHLDSHRAVIWFASDFLVSLYGLLAPIVLWGILAAPLLYALGIFTNLVVFGWLGFGLAVLQFFAWFTGVTADLGVYSPGANDNASSVGVALSLAERLQESPLPATEVWFVFSGCEETGCDGMRAFLDEYGSHLQDALFLDLELVGIGERLVYLQSEGVIRRRRIDRDLEARLTRLDGHSLQPLNWTTSAAFTEMGLVWERGLQGICLMVLRSGSNLLPEWHRMTDTPDHLSPAALEMAHAFAWDLLAAWSRSPVE